VSNRTPVTLPSMDVPRCAHCHKEQSEIAWGALFNVTAFGATVRRFLCLTCMRDGKS
jgi:hypothetical protein